KTLEVRRARTHERDFAELVVDVATRPGIGGELRSAITQLVLLTVRVGDRHDDEPEAMRKLHRGRRPGVEISRQRVRPFVIVETRKQESAFDRDRKAPGERDLRESVFRGDGTGERAFDRGFVAAHAARSARTAHTGCPARSTTW